MWEEATRERVRGAGDVRGSASEEAVLALAVRTLSSVHSPLQWSGVMPVAAHQDPTPAFVMEGRE